MKVPKNAGQPNEADAKLAKLAADHPEMTGKVKRVKDAVPEGDKKTPKVKPTPKTGAKATGSKKVAKKVTDDAQKKDAPVRGGGVVPPEFRKEYAAHGGNNGDDIAALLKDADLGAVATANGIDLNRWAGKNHGMVRMNLGNVLRGMVRRGEKVTIGGKSVKVAA